MRFVSSLRFRLLAFALVVALPMFLFVLTSYAELRSTEAADTKASALATARELATRQRSLIDQTRVLLATLAQLPQVRPRAGAECDALLAKLLDDSAGYAFMGTATVEGAVVCSAPASEGPVSVADRPYFRRALESGGTAFGDFQIGRVSGKAVLAAGTPLLDDEGTIEGVVIVSMDLVWLAQEAAVATLPPGTAVTVFDRAGQVLLRHPDPARWVGRDAGDTPLVETILAAAGEGTTEAVGLDGVRRLFAFSPLYAEAGLIGAYVSVGIPTTMAYAELDAIRDRTLIWLSVMAAVLTVLAWVGGDVLVLRRVTKLMLTTRRLAAGAQVARSGMAGATDELGELGQAFDEMADSLERQAAHLDVLQDLYRRAIAAAGAVPYQHNTARTAFTFMGEGIHLLTGYAADEMTPELWDSLTQEDILRGALVDLPVEEAIRRVRSGEIDAWTVDSRIRTHDGEERWISDTSVEVRDEDGRPGGSFGLLQNITDRKRAETRLQVLAEASHLFVEHTGDLQVLLDAIARCVAGRIGDTCTIRLLSDDGQSLKLVALHDPDPEALALVRRVISTATRSIAEQPIVREVIETGQPSLVVVDEPGWLPRVMNPEYIPLYQQLGTRSIITLPLRTQGATVGMIDVSRHSGHAPHSQEDLELAQEIADRAVLAISNARLLVEAQRRSERLQALNAIDKAIMTVQELPQTLEVIAQQVAVQLAVDAVDVLLYDRSSAELVFAACTGFREEDIRRSRLQLGEGHAGRAAAEQRIIFVPDLAASADAARLDLIMGEGFVSHVCVPLVVHGQLQGILDLFQRDRLAPDSEWFAFLEVLALQTAIALDHARLFSETQEQARQLDLLLKTVPQGVALLDRGLSLVMANPLGQTYLARLCAGPPGDKPLTRLGSRSMGEIVALGGLDPMKVAWQEVTVEGPTQIFEVASSPFRDNGHATGWVLVLDDVTEERRRQVEMRSQERLATVGQMAAGIAHDFNNILTPILIYSELAALALPESDRNYHNLQHVLTAVERAKELINQILLFARQSPPREHKPILLQPLVKEALRLVRAALPATIRIHEEIHARSPGNHATVVADPTQIHQIVINLCTNAQHAMRAHGGVLTVSLDEVDVDLDLAAAYPNLHVGSYVRLSVGDTGHGMTPEVQSRIFEPFFTTKRVGEGTGMGLAVVHGIVMDHGGEILVESWPGEGTVFRIYLPQTDGEAGDEEAREATLVRGTGKILVVDDEETLALAAQQILESLGYAVTCTSRSPEALELFRSQPDRFDLVITDLTMPDMTGIELAQEVLRIRSDMPIVLLTGFSAASTAEQVQMLGIRATLLKPFSAGELSRTVHQILEQQT